MTDPNPLSAVARITGLLHDGGVPFALVGGLAVSVRGEVRFTRDVDFAIVVDGDHEVETLIRRLGSSGYSPRAIVEQEAVGRIATVRLVGPDGITVDLLAASSGIEAEVVAAAEPIEMPPAGSVPVAGVAELVALKVLSVARHRKQDEIDLESLLRVNPDLDRTRVRHLLTLITTRGYHRNEDLLAKMELVFADVANTDR